MAESQHPLASAAPLGVVAALCVSLLLVANFRRNRARRVAGWVPHKQQQTQQLDNNESNAGRGGRAAAAAAAAAAAVEIASTDRRGPGEDDGQQVFSLYDSADCEADASSPPMELSGTVLALLESFDVDPVRGFLPRVDPLRRLPQLELQPWEAMAVALPSLLAVGRARKPLEALPELSIEVLTCQRERMRALLLLCVFAHASVWGNPDEPQGTIPRSVAVPLAALAAAEGMPPLLTHTSLVLHNWHRLDPSGPIRTENLACNCRFLGGLDETWFYIATVEIEARGGGVFGALLEAQHAIAEAEAAAARARTSDAAAAAAAGANGEGASSAEEVARAVLRALAVARDGTVRMRDALSRMPVGCHPLIFYQRVRPFLSGWKANPTLPDGVLYEGVSLERQQYYGGSAAQSTLFPALDAALGVSHSAHSSNAFLLEMRNYMPPGHRRLLEHLADPACPSIRRFVQNFPRNVPEAQEEVRVRSPPSPSEDRGSDCAKKIAADTAAAKETPENGGSGVGDGKKGTGGGCGAGEVHGATAEVHGDTAGGNGGLIAQGTTTATATATAITTATTADALREAYNGCLSALGDFRSTHLGIVSSYILQQQKKKDQKAGEAKSREDFAGGKGTGGTPLLDFLKPLKNDSRAVLLK